MNQRIDSLQILRAVAALLVVVAHAQHFLYRHDLAASGSFALRLTAGVDLFFVISGFVIVYASRHSFGQSKGPKDFILRRLIRIVPLYWLATTAVLLFHWLAKGAEETSRLGVAVVAGSYGFFPVDGHGFGADFPFPLLDLGWTLNYEMYFYVVFAPFLLLPRRMAVLLAAGVLASTTVLAAIWPPDSIALRFWSQPIILEFVLGALIGLARLEGVRLPALAGPALLAAGLLLWAGVDTFALGGGIVAPANYGLLRAAVDGGAAALVVAAATLCPWPAVPRAASFLVAMGGGSYALYLFHPFGLKLMEYALSLARPPAAAGPLLLVLFVAGMAAVAQAIHVYAEQPVGRWLTRRIVRDRRTVQPAFQV